MNIYEDPEVIRYQAGTGITIEGNTITADIGTVEDTVAEGKHTHTVSQITDFPNIQTLNAGTSITISNGLISVNFSSQEFQEAIDLTAAYDERYSQLDHNHNDSYLQLQHIYDYTVRQQHTHKVADLFEYNNDSSSDVQIDGLAKSSYDITQNSNKLVTAGGLYSYINSLSLSNPGTPGSSRGLSFRSDQSGGYPPLIRTIGASESLCILAGDGITFTDSVPDGFSNISSQYPDTTFITMIADGGTSSSFDYLYEASGDVVYDSVNPPSPGDMLVYTEITDNGSTVYKWINKVPSPDNLAGLQLNSNTSNIIPICQSYTASTHESSWGYFELDSNSLELVTGSNLGDPKVLRVKTASLGQYSVDGTTITSSNNQLSVNPSNLIDGTTLKVTNGVIGVDPSVVSGGGGLTVTGTPQDGDVLIYSSSANSGNGGWIPGTVSGSGSNNYVEITIPAGTSTYTSLPLVLNTGDIVAGWLHCIQAGQGAAGSVLAEFYADGAGNTRIYSMDPSTDRIEFWGNLDSNGNLQILPSNITYAWKIGFHYTVYRAPQSNS